MLNFENGRITYCKSDKRSYVAIENCDERPGERVIIPGLDDGEVDILLEGILEFYKLVIMITHLTGYKIVSRVEENMSGGWNLHIQRKKKRRKNGKNRG